MRREEGLLLRIFIDEGDKYEGHPLFEWVLEQARDHGVAGAIALRGLEGLGEDSRIHRAKILSLSLDLPVVVEVLGTKSCIESFIPLIEPAIGKGLITQERISMLLPEVENAG
jgi:PII-like signaling protein